MLESSFGYIWVYYIGMDILTLNTFFDRSSQNEKKIFRGAFTTIKTSFGPYDRRWFFIVLLPYFHSLPCIGDPTTKAQVIQRSPLPRPYGTIQIMPVSIGKNG